MFYELTLSLEDQELPMLLFAEADGLAALFTVLANTPYRFQSRETPRTEPHPVLSILSPNDRISNHTKPGRGLGGTHFLWQPGNKNLQSQAIPGYRCLPSDLTVPILLQTLKAAGFTRKTTRKKVLRLERNEQLLIMENQVVFIEKGYLRSMHWREDGEEIFLGVYGADDILLGHDSDHCQVSMVAHTDVTLTVKDWSEALREEGFHDKLLQRVCFLESWSAALAKANMEDRLRSLIFLLAQRYQEQDPEALLRTLRLTHEHLAQALGSVRSSVTRTMKKIRQDPEIRTADRCSHI